MLVHTFYSTIRWEDQSNTVIRTITASWIITVYGSWINWLSRSDSIFIEEKCPLIINIPNVSSPNGDQVNDIFRPSVEYVREFKLEIFSRWGERLFVSNDGNRMEWSASGMDKTLCQAFIFIIFFAEGYNEKAIWSPRILLWWRYASDD